MATTRSGHRLDAGTIHAFWDSTLAPRLHVRSGEVVEFESREASDNQLSPGSTAADVAALDFGRIHPLTGPVYVEDAGPGDTLQVEVLGFEHQGWGWTAQVPGFGLLADDFPEPYLNTWELGARSTVFRPGISIPLEPFCGVMGVGPGEPGRINTIPPRVNGGNIDVRQLVAGSKVYLPVLVPGALFSLGDTHAAQGDGEVCGTAIEAPMTVRARFTVRRDMHVRELQYEAPPGTHRRGPTFNTTAHAPDLMDAAKGAVRYMIDHLHGARRLSRQDAYALCSVAVDLKISEVVDAPNWIVTASLPLEIFA